MKVEVKTNEYSFNNLFYPVFRLVQAPIFYVLISNMSFSYCIWPFESEIQLNIERLTSSSTLDIQLHLDDGSVIECPHNVVVRIKPGNDGISLSWCINNPCVTPVSGLSNFWWYCWLLMTALISKPPAIKTWIKSSNSTHSRKRIRVTSLLTHVMCYVMHYGAIKLLVSHLLWVDVLCIVFQIIKLSPLNNNCWWSFG